MKKSFYKLLAILVLFSGCSAINAGSSSNEVKEVIDTDAEQNGTPPENKFEHASGKEELLSEKFSEPCALVIPENIQKNVPEEMQYSVFLQLILGLIRNEYVKELSEGQITEKAIAGLLSTLDPHSSYLNEKAFRALRDQTDGEFGGLGIEIMMDGGFVRIVSPIDDTPAYKAGLKSGDMIIYIDDECINGISIEEALEKLRGKPKTKVKLKIKRGDKVPFDVIVTRDLIKVQSVKAEMLDNIGYVRISTFDKNTSKDLKKFIKENPKISGLILDMRNNPGGLLDEAIEVSNMFLKKGRIVATRGRTTDNTKYFEADENDITNGLPLVVLINSGTASAPEIVSGALRDNKRAIIVGTRSFGKGSVQKVLPLSEKTAIKLTVAKHYTPSGECIQGNGITPDIEANYAVVKPISGVFIIREEFFSNALDADKNVKNKKFSDEQNEKAIEELNKKKEKEGDEEQDEELLYRKMPLKERVLKDYQLSKAFDVLKAVVKFGNIVGEAKPKKKTEVKSASNSGTSAEKNDKSSANSKKDEITKAGQKKN